MSQILRCGASRQIARFVSLDNERMAGIISMRDLMAVDLDDEVETTITLLNAYVQCVPADIAHRR